MQLLMSNAFAAISYSLNLPLALDAVKILLAIIAKYAHFTTISLVRKEYITATNVVFAK